MSTLWGMKRCSECGYWGTDIVGDYNCLWTSYVGDIRDLSGGCWLPKGCLGVSDEKQEVFARYKINDVAQLKVRMEAQAKEDRMIFRAMAMLDGCLGIGDEVEE